jgi:phage major head subunit gpT-like protein
MSSNAHNDKPMGIIPNLLVVGPKLRTTAWDIVKNQFNYNDSDKVQVRNVNENLVDLLISPELIGTYDDYWFLLSTKGIIKPVIVQKGKETVLTRLDRDTDKPVFMEAMCSAAA